MVPPVRGLVSSESVRVSALPFASGLYIPIETVSCGTNPVNQIDFEADDVPVLPAIGRSRRCSFVADPPGLTV